VNRRLAQNAIAPQYDGSQVNRLTADLKAVQQQVVTLQQQRIQLEASLNADSVKAQLDAIANQPRMIYYAAVVQMPDVQALQSSIQAELRATIDSKELRSAAPDIGKAIAKEVNESKVKVDQGGLLGGIGRVLFSGTASVFRGFQESIGQQIFSGLSKETRAGFRNFGGKVESVSNAVVSPIKSVIQSEDIQSSLKNATDKASEYLRRGAYRFGDALADAIDAESNKVKAFTDKFNDGLSAEKLRSDFQSVAKDAKEIKDEIVSAVAKGAEFSGIFEPLGNVLAKYREIAIEERSIALATQRAAEILANGKATQQFGTYTDKAGNLKKQFVKTANVVDENTDELVISIGGYGKAQGRSGLRIPGLLDLPERSKAISVLNPDTDIRRKDENDRLGKVTEMIKSLSKPNLRGYSKDAIEIVAQALVAIERNQNVTIKLLGESGGGYPAEEAERILQKLGYGDRVKRLSVGTPDLPGRLIQGNKIISPDEILGRETAVLSRLGAAKKPTNITGVTDHPIENYLKVAEVQNLLYGAPPPFSDADITKIQSAAKNFERIAKKDLGRGEKEKVAAEALTYLEAVRRRFLVAVGNESTQLGQLAKEFEIAYSNFSEEPEAFKRMRSVLRQASELTGQIQGSGLQGANTGSIIKGELSQYQKEFKSQYGATAGIGTEGAKAAEILSETQAIITKLSDPTFFARPIPEKAPIQTAIAVAEPESSQGTLAKLTTTVGGLVDASKKATKALFDLENQMTFGLAGRYREFLSRQAQNTLGLTGQYAGAVGRQVLLPGAARAIGGAYGALQGAERTVLGIAPFGLGYGAKGLIQAGAGFAAINAVAPGAAGLITGAGSGLGGALASQIGSALTGAAVESAPGMVAPIVQAIGAGITGLLAAGGGTVGAGVAALGAGATGVNLTGKIAAKLNPLPELLALPERKEAQDSGRLLAQAITTQVIEGVKQNAKSLPDSRLSIALPIPRVETARNLLDATRNRVSQERTGLEQGGAGLVVSELRGRLGGIKSRPVLQPEDIANLKVALLLVERISLTLGETKAPANKVFKEFPGQFEEQFQAMQSNKGQLGRIRSNALEAIAQFAPSIRAAAKAGDDTAAGYIESIRKSLPQIEETASATAKKFIVTIKKELGIASPSRVMIGIAQDLMAGLPIGVRSKLAEVSTAAIIAKETFLKSFAKGELKTKLNPSPETRPQFIAAQRSPVNSAIPIPSPFLGSDFVIPKRQYSQRLNSEPLALPSAEMRASDKNADLNQFYAGSIRQKIKAPEIDDSSKKSNQEKAYKAGQEYGQRVGDGLKSAGKFVDTEARRLGDRIPEGVKDGARSGIVGIKGFVSGLSDQFAKARQEIPTLDFLAKGIKNIALLAGGSFVGFQLFQVITTQAGAAYEAIKRLESQKVVVNFATGSTAPLEAAEKQAKALGVNLVTARDSIKSLAIQAKNTPLEQKVVPIFEGASTAAAALQLNPEQQGRLFTAFNQIAGKGTVQSEELRQQLGELGVSFQLAARAAGMTTSEFNKQLAAGAVLSQDFLPKFANQLKLELGGAAIAAGDSLQGLENKVANAATKLRESLGKESVPLASAGLKSFAGILEFAGNNVSTLTNLINVALIGALVKGGQAFKAFAFEQNIAVGTNVSPTGRASRAGLAGRGIRDFVSEGGIQRAANSPLAKDLASIGAQVITISAGIGAFQTITEGFTGGERYQEFNRVLETTEKRIQAINAAERERLAIKNDQPGRTGEEVNKDKLQTTFGAIGDLTSLNFKGFFQKTARNVQQTFGGDPTTALSNGFLATQDQADNRRILNNASDLIQSRKFQAERNKAFGLANQLKNNQAVDPNELKASRETIQSRLDLLKAVPEDLRKIRPEIDAEIKQLEGLQKALGGTGSAYSKLVKAAKEFEDILSKQNALEKAVTGANASRGRAEGVTNEFDAKVAELKAQSTEATKNRAALGNLVKASETFLGSQEFAALKLADPDKAEAEQKRLLDLKTQFAGADKQIDDLITQNRLDAVNRRAELLQREVSNQERAIAKLESIRRVRTTGRDAGLSEGVADRTITPQSARLQQSQNAFTDSQDAIIEQAKKRENALKNLKKAQADLSQINPNDEQQFEQGKAAVAQYEQAVLGAEAEINNQRKSAADAVTQFRIEAEEQVRTQIDLTTRKAEQGITAQQQATERLGNAQKRQIENSVAGLQRQQKFLDLAASAIDRAAKLSGKRSELNTAINQGAQIPLSGTIAAIRDAEGLIQRLKQKDLDPGVRGRTTGVLNQLGISINEQDAFRYRIREEEKLARLKAEGISAEIQQSQVTLDFEQRREEFASKRAVLAAQETVEAAKRSAIETEIERKKAENEARRSQIGIAKATVQLDLAQQSGDPNKVREAQLNLQDAQLQAAGAQDTLLGARQTEKLAKDALPNATLSVVDALANFAATIEGGKLSRRILGAQNQNKAAQFGQEERGRVRGLAIEGIDKGVSVDINNGGALGLDPFGFRASRAKDAAINAADRQRFQNNIKGIPNRTVLPAVAPSAEPVDVSKAFGSDASSAVDASIKAISAAINFNPVTDKLAQLIEIEARLSAQILSLAGRDQVKITNQAYYGQERSVLRGTTL
jgi:tape measure domain-containing protein